MRNAGGNDSPHSAQFGHESRESRRTLEEINAVHVNGQNDDFVIMENYYYAGNAEITWSPPQIGLNVYGQDTWIDFGVRYNSCYVDVKYCNQTGFSVTFWIAFQEASTTQGLIEFGNGDCGLSITRTTENEINATIKSMELNSTWSLHSVNASVRHGIWHHLALTWNASGEVYLFINGTRLNNVIQRTTPNVSCSDTNCKCDWSMKVGTVTFCNSSARTYPSLLLARLVLWNYSINDETVLGLSQDVQGVFLSNRGCYGGWIANLQFCYFIASNWKKTWHEAREICVKRRGNLVSIGSLEEDDFLEEVLKKTKEVSSCIYIGLQTGHVNLTPSWEDKNVWKFSKLSTRYDQENSTDLCAYRYSDGLWYLSNCSEKCGFMCKKYRGGLFKNAEFHCRERRYNRQLVGHRLSIRWVQNELNCAIDCLLYGATCASYNYKQSDSSSKKQNICELNNENQHKNPTSLIYSSGFQYCERVS
ncbi:C-type lectin domain family 12 member B [Stylophora pistillata]|uniref:C-type lectin domain family 12 member B n=1 Tax=Stylophora pistillata TaxID=50429 RepID=A0A2B4SEZ0_STYPI|nr:C-type lectin domain family 12 member B [Stylophora pistillata]